MNLETFQRELYVEPFDIPALVPVEALVKQKQEPVPAFPANMPGTVEKLFKSNQDYGGCYATNS